MALIRACGGRGMIWRCWTVSVALLVVVGLYGCGDDDSSCEAVCGNGEVECDETCDDGNVLDGDGCSSLCGIETCQDSDGDGATDAACGGTDCDDSRAAVHPGAVEVCGNGVDDDCDSGTPDVFDGDGDGADCTVDCDDGDAAVSPSATEICGNEVDDDCDSGTPDVFDGDGDGDDCDVDCDDGDPDVGPSRTEIPCNNVDDDCSSATPDGVDGDGDGYTTCGGDCDDSDEAVHPGAAEICGNGVDDDCDTGTPDVFDGDGDGDDCTVDCDDASALVGPSRSEVPCSGVDEDCNPATPDALDVDGDGVTTCGGDCDDSDETVHPGAAEICDNGVDDDCDDTTPDIFDGDGDGDACDVDCDDDNTAVGPTQTEVPCNNVDDDCDPGTPDGVDGDGDGYSVCGGDCDDSDGAVHPGAAEICDNGVNDDCDTGTLDIFDGDGDGDACDVDCDDDNTAVGPSRTEVACNNVDDDCDPGTPDGVDGDDDGYTTCGGDCDDGAAAVHPGAAEVCGNGVDDDCDPGTPDVFDGDGDGDACDVDCDDERSNVGPSRTEVPCNTLDDDCDPGTPDETDGDGDNWTNCQGDCNDTLPTVNPSAAEVCGNGLDDDCDSGTPDVWDGDGDGDGCDVDCHDGNPDIGPGQSEVLCNGVDDDCSAGTPDDPNADGDAYSHCAGDCDDGNPNVHPGRAEVTCNGLNDDCLSSTPDDPNVDGDPYTLCGGDCDDGNELIHPGRSEVTCNGVDDDCNPSTADWADGDSDGWSDCAGDCDDGNPNVHPGQSEVTCNAVNDDCDDGTPDDPNVDGDAYSLCNGDCDDGNPNVHPGQPEVTCNALDDDCDPATLDAPDGDNDGYTVCDDCDDDNQNAYPGAAEVCDNGVDDDCDDGTPDVFDGDHDTDNCVVDCDDDNPDVGPSQTEDCTNGVDDDCDLDLDCDDPDCAGDAACQGGTCQDAITLTQSGVHAYDTAGRPNSHSGTCQAADGGELVFKIDLTEESELHVDTEGSDYDTVLYLRESPCDTGAELACNDDVNDRGEWSRLQLTDLSAGSYYLFVDSASPATGGSLQLNVVITPELDLPSLSAHDDPLVRMPGTQPADGVTMEDPNRCMNCHEGYDTAAEPGFNWKGSMMSQASRDFVFWAAFVVAAQDAIWATGRPNATDICERCHFPKGWIEGRSTPTNASSFTSGDYDGVSCDFCHQQWNPFFEDTHSGTREGSDWVSYWDETETSGTPSQAAANTTYAEDTALAAAVTFFNGNPYYGGTTIPAPPGYVEAGSGAFFISPNSQKRASFADANANHSMLYSRFHKSREFCASCHDVSNPVLANLAHANVTPGDGSTVLPSEANPAYSFHHVERTFSEFRISAYGQQGGTAGIGPYAPGTFQTSLANNYIARCQDCHMRDVVGKGCDKSQGLERPTDSTEHPMSGQPKHTQTGGNMFVTWVLASTDSGSSNYDATNAALLSQGASALTLELGNGQGIDPDALLEGTARAQAMLEAAADIQAVSYNDSTGALSFRIQNQTGHKLISGFPEGRRMFVNIQLRSGGNLIHEVNPYDGVVGTLKGLPLAYSPNSPALTSAEEYRDELVIEMHPTSALTGEVETFHFVLATGRYKDNRIPPKGFDIVAAADRLVEPVWHGVVDPGYFSAAEYAGGYMNASLTVPSGADQVTITLYYQTTSREYMEFLRDQINGTGTSLASPSPAGRAMTYVIPTDPFFDGLRAWGDTIWQLWEHNKDVLGAAPVPMTQASWP